MSALPRPGSGASRRICLLLGLLAAGLLWCAPAQAFPKFISVPPVVFVQATAAAGNGYRLQIQAFRVVLAEEGGPRSSSTVLLTLSKDGREAQYFSADATVGGDGSVEMDLGSLGGVRVEFEPRRHLASEPFRGCLGAEQLSGHGTLRGRVAFRGERGYTSFGAGAVRATLFKHGAVRCPLGKPTKAPKESGSTRVGGDWFHSGGYVGFTATPHPGLGTVGLVAWMQERRGRLTILRSVQTMAPAAAAEIERNAGTATIAPPAPFRGSAAFAAFQGKKSGTWLGSLEVDFPGRPDVRLAGERFHGSLLTGNECSTDGSSCISIGLLNPIGVRPVRAVQRR